MSHETRPSVTKAENPLVHEQEIDTHDRPNRSRRAFLIGAGSTAAALALAGGLFVGLKGGDAEKTEPRNEPSNSAPANPTESAPSVPETTPTALELANDSVQLVGPDGKVYSGREAFVAAIESTTEKYPETQAAVTAFFEEDLNNWINAGNTPQDQELYGKEPYYTSADGQRFGNGAVVQDFYQPAYQEALIGSGEYLSDNQGQTPDNVTAFMNELNFENMALYSQTKNDEEKFYAGFKIEGEPDLLLDSVPVPGNPDMKATSFRVKLVYSDNGHLNTVGEKRSEPGGYRDVTTPQYVQNYEFVGGFVELDGTRKLIQGSFTPVDEWSY